MAAHKKTYPPPPSESKSSGSGSEGSSEDESTESPPPGPPPSQTNPPAKKAIVPDSKPEAKPGNDEGSGSSLEGEGSVDEGSDDEATAATKPVKDSALETPGDSAESDSGSESESDSDNEAAAKVAVAKSVDARKRVVTGSGTGEGKPAKRARPSTPVAKSREDDEIAILTGMRDFVNKGSNPFTDATGFYEFVRESLSHHGDPEQVADTLRRLKGRYQSAQSRAKKGKITVPHEGNRKTIFELSKMIWNKRNGGVMEDSAVASPDGKNRKKRQSRSRKVLEFETESDVEKPEQKSVELANGRPGKELPNGHPANNLLFIYWKELQKDDTRGLKLMKEGLELLEPSVARMLEERWKKIEIAKLEILQKQRDLFQEQMKMVLDALKQQRR
ncbi:hypothetical protein H6P81_015557 [Aristolochia fimbriata]|uniref:Glabrous enhancer-binding protein-like DBD domain-containing protein n=1 Tax=Aristolochia fimbriata TaxID=158543 RepID=A0AAV7E603_ARIFI|nr:hypothetical protein H6P81_015557 [Aristolochia fimbriata]